jgi:hypothetical protein
MYRREAKSDGRAAVCCSLCDSNERTNESSRGEASLLWNTRRRSGRAGAARLQKRGMPKSDGTRSTGKYPESRSSSDVFRTRLS